MQWRYLICIRILYKSELNFFFNFFNIFYCYFTFKNKSHSQNKYIHTYKCIYLSPSDWCGKISQITARKEFCKHVVHCVPGSDLKFDRVPGLVCVLDKRDSAVTTWVDNIGQLIHTHTHAYLVIRYVHTYALCIVHNEVYLIVCMYICPHAHDPRDCKACLQFAR